MPELIRIGPGAPSSATLSRAAEILRSGGILAYPTETFYGLGAAASSPAAVEKIFEIKGRHQQNPIPLIIGDTSMLACLVEDIPEKARLLMEKFWPGPLTLVFRASATVNPALTGGTGKIGIRLSSHPLARALSREIAGAITATSANLTGASECVSAQEVISSLEDRVQAVVDGGPTPGGKGSTVIDISSSPPRIFRYGTVPAEAIERILGRIS